MNLFLFRHMDDFLSVRPALTHYRQLAFIDPGRTKLTSLVNTDHAMHFVFSHLPYLRCLAALCQKRPDQHAGSA